MSGSDFNLKTSSSSTAASVSAKHCGEKEFLMLQLEGKSLEGYDQ